MFLLSAQQQCSLWMSPPRVPWFSFEEHWEISNDHLGVGEEDKVTETSRTEYKCWSELIVVLTNPNTQALPDVGWL